jgi:hypothetical protein
MPAVEPDAGMVFLFGLGRGLTQMAQIKKQQPTTKHFLLV